MAPGALAFLIFAGIWILVIPRRVAAIPLLAAMAYTTRDPFLQLGPANLSVLRVLVLIGFVRVFIRREWIANGISQIDRLVFLWATLFVALATFHNSDAWTFRLGLVLAEVGFYVLCRTFIQNLDDARATLRLFCVLIAPLAILMMLERVLAHNFFAIMGGPGNIRIREGRVRANGPFAMSILAGTVGAVSVPLTLSLWQRHRIAAIIGTCSALAIVFASTSSGPILAVCAGVFALSVWYIRRRTRFLIWSACASIAVLQLVMNDPVYFLVARIDLAGGSTGWFRAQLIRSSLNHLSEWWAVGTDYTRHWMPSGIHANQTTTDITNHFLQNGVWGGLPLLVVFILMLRSAFRTISKQFRAREADDPETAYLIWCFGGALFVLVVTFWSISLYDQSDSMLYLVLAMIASAVPMKGSTVVAPANVRSCRPTGVVTGRPRRHGDVSVSLQLPQKFGAMRQQ